MAYKKTGGILTIAGLDTSKPAEYIGDQNTPDCQNMLVDRQILRKRVGSSLMGATTLNDEAVLGGHEFERAGTTYVVRIGPTKVEEWDDANDEWDDITGSDLTADTTYEVDTAAPLLTGQRILVFTNYKDNPRKYTGAGNTADLGGSPPKGRYVVSYKSYLLFANINDGNPRPARVAWSDTGDIETWSGGNSGTVDLLEEDDDITGMAIYGNYVAVHKENCIYLGYLVSTSSIFKFDRKPTGNGTIANNTIKMLPTGDQVFLANDGIRLFNGITTKLIETAVTDDIRQGLNPDYSYRSWGIVVSELDEYWCAMPIGSDEYPNTIYRYNYKYGTVHKDTRTDVTCAFKYTTTSQPAWDDFDLTWEEMTDRWDDKTNQSNFRKTIIGNATGYTLERDTGANNDNSTAIDSYWESKDFQSEEIGRMNRWFEMELWAKGNSVTVEYSTDSGSTWEDATTFSLDSSFPSDDDPDHYYFDTVASKIRFRFRNQESGETFYLKQFIVKYNSRELR